MTLPWLQSTETHLLEQNQAGRLPQVQLLFGQTGVGKYVLIEQLARHLLCLQPNENHQACGVCASCELFNEGTHPDVKYVTPDGASQMITIGQIRETITFIGQTPLMGRFRLVLLRHAERMNMPAANALLKVLEEPPSKTLFFLTTRELSAVLPTIRSRCIAQPVPLPSRKHSVAWLETQDYTPSEVTFALMLASGAPLAAQALLLAEQLPVYQKSLAIWIDYICQRQDAQALVTDWLQYDSEHWLDCLLVFALDIIRLRYEVNEVDWVINFAAGQIATLIQATTTDAWLQHYALVLARKKVLKTGCVLNKQLLLEDIVLSFGVTQSEKLMA